MLPFVQCCKEGIPTGQSPSGCSDFQSLLPTNNGEGDVQSAPPPENESGDVGKQRTRRFFGFFLTIIISICEWLAYVYDVHD